MALAGAVLFVDAFLPWFRRCTTKGGFNDCADRLGWGYPLSIAVAAIGLLVAAQVIGRWMTSSEIGPPWATAYLAVGALALVLVVVQLAIGDGGAQRWYGVWIGLAVAVCLVAGGALRRYELAGFEP